MAFRYLGKGTTDESGKAHLTENASGQTVDPAGYVGSGVGLVDIVASMDKPITESSIQSNTYEVWDTYLFDNGTDSTHNIWDTPYQCSIDWGSEYATITETTEYGFIKTATAFPKNCIIELDYYNVGGVNQSSNFQFQTSADAYITHTTMGYLGLNANTWYHLKFEIKDGVLKVYKDNATTPAYTFPSSGSMSIATDNIKFIILTTGSTTEVRFKNLKIYGT